MRASMHNGRTGSARHNDRSFMAGLSEDYLEARAGHIDRERTKDNDYIAWDNGTNLYESELRYYQTHYQAALDAQNERYRASRRPEHCKTIEQVYRGARTAPEESILQIGNISASVSPETLRRCMEDYTQWLGRWSKAHGNHMHILTAALHADEATPHIHLRRVWDVPDKDGNPTLNQSRALKLSGVELPHPDKPEGRYNNRKMTFDAMCRERWHEICKDHGIELETEPIKGVRHKDTRDYALQQHRALQEEEKQAKEVVDMRNRAKSQYEAYTAQNEALRASKPQSRISFRESKINRDEVIISKDDFGYLMQQTAITETALANLDKMQQAHDEELESKDEEIEELRTARQAQSIDDKIKQAAREAKLQRYEAAERLYPAVMAKLLDGRYQDDRERDR